MVLPKATISAVPSSCKVRESVMVMAMVTNSAVPSSLYRHPVRLESR